MLLNKIKSRQLTTWKTKVCLSCFPYGSSPWPPIATFILTQIPALTLNLFLFLQEIYILAVYLALIQFIILISMLKVLTTNPGILPQLVYRCETDEDLFQIPSRPARPEHKYLLPQLNMLHHEKYCGECHIYRPIRSIHCSACNHCVERYDHHCPWLAICIGKYNYKYFLAYLISLVVLIISCFAIGLAFTVMISSVQISVVSDFVVYMLIGLIAFIFLFPIGRLLIYHITLIHKGLTTNQQIKTTYSIINNELPYEKLECELQRQKRLPKYSYRLQRIKQPQIIRQSSFLNDGNDSNREQFFSLESSSKEYNSIQKGKTSMFNSFIKNSDL